MHTRGRARTLVVAAATGASALALHAAPALACTVDDTGHFDGLVDEMCLKTPLAGAEIDALGGLRLSTSGVAVRTQWDTDAELDGGVQYEGQTFGPVGASTLARAGAGAAATLALPDTLLALTPIDGAVLDLGVSPSSDGDHVRDPSVVRTDAGFAMYYAAFAEDGGSPAVHRATSPDGVAWTKDPDPVLEPSAGTFDARGVTAPEIVRDPGDTEAPWRMYYAGQGDVFTGIGLATSQDGVTWEKHDGPVLEHGPGGAADSFRLTDPSVLHDGSVWRMWYTADDSTKRRIAYATSADGVTWSKGGQVIDTTDSIHVEFGAFSPTVWKDGATLTMILSGRKTVQGGDAFQTKLVRSESTDGVHWSAPGPDGGLNPGNGFDASNLDAPDVLAPSGGGDPYRLFYAGDSLDEAGNGHTRIGLATSNAGAAFARVAGAGTDGSVLDLGAPATAFDARSGGGLSVVAPAVAGEPYAGFHAGVRGSDFISRLGVASSADAQAFTAVPNAGALFEPGNGNAFDAAGHEDPSALLEGGSFRLFFTAEADDGTRSIGRSSVAKDAVTGLPGPAWGNRAQVLEADGAGFDAAGVEAPSVIEDGAGSFLMAYTGIDAEGVARIGTATAAGITGAWTQGAQPVLALGAAGSFDADGMKDAVLLRAGAGDFRLLYTGVESVGDRTVERIGYATSPDGATWTKQGAVLEPTGGDEVAVRPTGMLVDGPVLRVFYEAQDATARRRAYEATAAFPTVPAPEPGAWSGSVTYQLGSADTPARDFRSLTLQSIGDGAELWLSFLQPYSSPGDEHWSSFFPVAEAAVTDAELNLLLDVRAVRLQLRLRDPAGAPEVDAVAIDHAPVQFGAQATVDTLPLGAPVGRHVTAWQQLQVDADQYGTGPAAASVAVHDTASDQLLAAQPLGLAGATVVDLSQIDPQAHPTLRVRLSLSAGDGQASPLVRSLGATFTSAAGSGCAPACPPPTCASDPALCPPPPPPSCPASPSACPAASTLTLTASKTTVTFGKSVVLAGSAPAGAAVSLTRAPLGSTVFVALAAPLAGANGAFSQTVAPRRHTTYAAAAPGVGAAPTVTVRVRHKVTLRTRLDGSRLTFRGRVGPRHRGRAVAIQRKTTSGWVKYGKATTTKRSRFRLEKPLRLRGRQRFRARVAKDARHLTGRSVVRSVRR